MSSWKSSWLFTALLCSSPCSAHKAPSARSSAGLVGYGITMWKPSCAYACRNLLALSPLECSEHQESEHERLVVRHGGHDETFSTSPDCFNHDRAFLLTLAWCLHEHCEESHGTALWQLERFWETDAVPEAHHTPNYTYTEALAQVGDKAPEVQLHQGHALKEPSAVLEENYASFQTYLQDFGRVESQHSHYG